MGKQISQREARRLKQRVRELEEREARRSRAWVRDYMGGVHIGTVATAPDDYAAVLTARKLGHAVVVTCPDSGYLMLHAVEAKA